MRSQQTQNKHDKPSRSEVNARGEEVCHTICATKDRGCNAQHSFAEGGVNLLGAHNDDGEYEVQGPPGLNGRHIS